MNRFAASALLQRDVVELDLGWLLLRDRDGRILAVVNAEAAREKPLTVIVNWTARGTSSGP